MIVGGSFPMPMAGGSINYVYRLLKGIDDLPYFVFTGDTEKKANELFDCNFGHKVIRSPYMGNVLETHYGSILKQQILNLITVIQIVYYIIKFRPKVICCTEISLLTTSLFIAKILHKYKLVLFTYAEEIQVNKKRFVHGRVIKKAIKVADIIITVCDFTRNLLNSISWADDKIIKIIPSVKVVKPVCFEKKENDEKLIILTVARLSERKGHIDVLYAIDSLRNEFRNIEYRIVGSGSYENKIKEKIRELNLEKYVKIVGGVTDDELELEYLRADIFVLHHKQLADGDTEGCPTVFLEAGLHHLPVVGGEAGGVSDAIKDKETGFICHIGTTELYDSLKRLISDKELRTIMGEKGYNYARSFTQEHQSAIFRNLICSLLPDKM